jgi:hypothetical protein
MPPKPYPLSAAHFASSANEYFLPKSCLFNFVGSSEVVIDSDSISELIGHKIFLIQMSLLDTSNVSLISYPLVSSYTVMKATQITSTKATLIFFVKLVPSEAQFEWIRFIV